MNASTSPGPILGRLLVVDDEVELQTALCEMLPKHGYEAVGFTSGKDALEALKEREFDLLLADLMMPEMDGIALLRSALDLDPNLLGIIMTGQGTVPSAVEAMKVGAFDYLLKPFKFQAVLPTLSRAMEVRRLRLHNVQLRETVAIYELSMAIAFALDPDTVLAKLADSALQQCEADEVSVMLPTADATGLYVAVVRGERPGPILGEQSPMERGIAGWVARQRQPLTLHGEVRDPRFAPIRPRPEICCAVSMPMLVGGTLVGVLNVNATNRRRGFTLGQVKALNILTGIAASALENTRLHGQVRTAEEKYRSLFEHAVEGIFQTTPDGRFLAANSALADILGYDSPEELMATVKDISGQVYLDPARRAELVRLLHEREAVHGFESQALRKDGSVIWISETTRAIRDAHGTLLGYEGMVVDVTQRKRAEDEVRNLARFPAENPAPVLRLDRDGHTLYANQAGQALLRAWGGEMGGQISAVWRDRVAEAFTAQAQQVFDVECGERVYALTLSPVSDAAYVNVYGTDITERKQAERALLTRTRQLEAVRAVTEEITRELDVPTLLSLITRRAADLLGAKSGLIALWDETAQVLIPKAGCGFGEWIRDVRFRLGEGVTGTVAQRREGLRVNDYRTSPYAHPLFVERARITATLNEPLLYRDRLVGVIGIVHQETDTTFTEEDRQLLALFAAQAAIAIENAKLYEEKRMAALHLEGTVEARTRELEAANRQLQEVSRHKSEFLANMSHELRTPLNSVIGFSELMLEQRVGPLNEKQARYLTHVRNGGKHLLTLINDILDLSKVEAGKLELHPESLPVAQTLEDILVIGRGLAHKKGQIVEADIEAGLPPLQADPVRLKQILFNLLSNAVKFTPAQGRITVRAGRAPGIADCRLQIADWEKQKTEGRKQGAAVGAPPGQSEIANLQSEMLEIAVRDTGTGIRAEDLPRLFQEFTQLETTQAQRHEGSGLGLALTRKLVELHGGRIWATSEGEGRGSTFTVLLPFEGPRDKGTE